MELSFITAKAIFQLFLILGSGFFLAKAKVFTMNTATVLTDLLVYLTNPLAIATSYLSQEFDAGHSMGLLAALGLSAFVLILMNVLAKAAVKKGTPNWEINRTAPVYTNVGYVGLPLITAVLGQEGAFFLTSFIAVNTFLIFTHGQNLFTGDFSKKSVIKCLVSPNIVAIYAGLFLYVTQIKVPELVLVPMEQIAGCNACLAMLVSGITIAYSKMGDALKRPWVYAAAAVKLLLMPLLLMPFALLFELPQEVFLAALIGAACPAAAFVPIFALMERKDTGYAYAIFTVSTLGCIATVPLMVALYLAIG